MKSNLGTIGEKIAADFLVRKGFKILDKNYKNSSGYRLGEIDIIAKDPVLGEIVFVEVKTRDYQKYGQTLPEENITYSKLKKLQKIANAYLLKKKWRDKPFRFDAISIWLDLTSKKAKIKHLPSIYL
jgi:putative endonuclease